MDFEMMPYSGRSFDLRELVDAIPAIISYYDRDLICRFANKYHDGWHGRTHEDVVGLHQRDVVGAPVYAAWHHHLERVKQGEAVSFQWAMPDAEGAWRETAIRFVPRMTADGFDGLYVLAFDVAAHEHKFYSIFDATAVGFWIIDLANLRANLDALGLWPPQPNTDQLKAMLISDPDFVRRNLDTTPVISINGKAAEMFGVSQLDAQGMPLGHWCPDASLPVFTQNLIAFMGGASYFEAETVMASSQGRQFDVLLTAAYARKDLGDTSVILGTTDISARIAREQDLARLQAELTHAARVATLGELTASIAHEVNQPLAAVVTNGNAAVRWLDRPTPDVGEALSAIRRIIAEGTRASDIIARTRAFAVKRKAESAVFDINEMISDTVELVQRQVTGLGAELALKLAPRSLLIEADRIQIQQVLINLIVNAAQAMVDTQGPRILTIRSSELPGKTLIEVADTGPGLGDDAERLFDAFFTTKASGMGMGLSISRTIVEAHGGTITASAHKDGGAEFHFSIPLAADDPRASEERQTKPLS